MGSRPIRQYLWLPAAVLLSIMLVITAVSLVAIHAEDGTVTELSTVVGPAHDQATAIMQAMTDAESSLRGFIGSGDQSLLEPYGPAKRQVRATQRQLRALLVSPLLSEADRRGYTRLETAQDAAIAAWWAYAEQLRSAAKYGYSDSLRAGQKLFDRVHAANGALNGVLTARRQALRVQSGQTLIDFLVILLATTVLAVLAGFAVASRMSRAVTVAITRLRQAVQRAGTVGLRADEDDGPAEIRDLAAAFNSLTARNTELAAAQAAALRLQQEAGGIGRAIRATRTIQEALEVTCVRLGTALAARRVMVTAVDETPAVTAAAQWHAAGLADLPGLADLEPYLGRLAAQVAGELWSVGERVVVNDLLAEKVQRHDWAGPFHRYSGATAAVLVPIGLAERALGIIYVLTDTGRRDWAEAEVAAAQQVATFLARAITQTEYETQRADYIARLEQLDRQKTDFLSTVSHELRTPLTSIQGYLELLLDEDAGPLAGDQRRMLGVVERNTTRLRGLIEDLLVLNKIESSGLVPVCAEVPVSELARHTVEELRPVADKAAVRLLAETGGDPALVAGDRTQLHRALVNVVSNAIKFTPSGGTVRLSCRIDPDQGEAVVTCEDTGIGIPEADLEHLFTRFFRASNANSQAIPGTGLGLAIVQAIVEAHHGRLALASAEDQGTTVSLRLPLARSRAAAPDR